MIYLKRNDLVGGTLGGPYNSIFFVTFLDEGGWVIAASAVGQGGVWVHANRLQLNNNNNNNNETSISPGGWVAGLIPYNHTPIVVPLPQLYHLKNKNPF